MDPLHYFDFYLDRGIQSPHPKTSYLDRTQSNSKDLVIVVIDFIRASFSFRIKTIPLEETMGGSFLFVTLTQYIEIIV